MALPTFQAVGTPASGVGNITPTWPTHQANDVGFLVCETVATQAVTAPDGWTAILNSPQSLSGESSSNRLSVFWKRAAGASETDPTVVDPGDHVIGVVITYRGCLATGDPWDVGSGGAVNPGASTAVTIGGATTTVADCLV